MVAENIITDIYHHAYDATAAGLHSISSSAINLERKAEKRLHDAEREIVHFVHDAGDAIVSEARALPGQIQSAAQWVGETGGKVAGSATGEFLHQNVDRIGLGKILPIAAVLIIGGVVAMKHL